MSVSELSILFHWPVPEKYYFYYCTLFILWKFFLVLLNLFLHMNLCAFSQFFTPSPQDANGTLTNIFFYKLILDWHKTVSFHLCIWHASSFMQAVESFFHRGLGHSILNLFPSVFYFVAIENEFVNSIEVFCYKPRCWCDKQATTC